MNHRLKINVIGIMIIILVFLIGRSVSYSQMQEKTVYISSFGFLALLSILFVLSIPLIYKLKKSNFTSILLMNRRWIGVYTFIFALIHVFLVSEFFFDWNILKIIENKYRVLGVIAFTILVLMAVTSNDKSLRLLKKNWKRLHYLVYAALILIIIHSFNLGLIFMKSLNVRILIMILASVIIIWKIRNKIKK